MDRFVWTDGLLGPEEQLVVQQNGVKIYDGDDKVSIQTRFPLHWKGLPRVCPRPG